MDTDNPVNSSKQIHVSERVAIGFDFYSCWLRKGRVLFKHDDAMRIVLFSSPKKRNTLYLCQRILLKSSNCIWAVWKGEYFVVNQNLLSLLDVIYISAMEDLVWNQKSITRSLHLALGRVLCLSRVGYF